LTVIRTFRLDQDVDEALKRISEEDGESVNVIANRTLRKFVEWDRLAQKIGMMQISRQELVRMMDTLTVDEARALGSWVGSDTVEPQVRYLNAEINLDTFVRLVDLLARYSGRFKFDHTVAGGKHVMVIHHSMGPKWSAFYEGAGSKVLGELLHIDFVSNVTDELCSFEFTLEGRETSEKRGVPG